MMSCQEIRVPRGVFNCRMGGDEAGFPVVALHGWPESSYCWEPLARRLDPGLRCIAPDLRGLGDSERTQDVARYQKVELARDVWEILDHLGIEDFFLIGHDWGGIVAQEVALARPTGVKKLMLMNIPVITNRRGNSEAQSVMNSRGSVPLWYQYFQQQPRLPEAMIPGNEEVWVSYFFGRAGREGRIPRETIAEYVRCYAIDGTPFTGAAYYRSMRDDVARWATLGGQSSPCPPAISTGRTIA